MLDTTRNWAQHSTFDGSYDPRTFSGKLDPLELQSIRLESLTAKLASFRARETKRDFNTVMQEVQLEVFRWLGRILAKSMDPVFNGSKDVVIEEDGAVCGVCQEDMNVGVEGRMLKCMHKFHSDCIVNWLRSKATCPLCRYQVQFKEFEPKIWGRKRCDENEWVLHFFSFLFVIYSSFIMFDQSASGIENSLCSFVFWVWLLVLLNLLFIIDFWFDFVLLVHISLTACGVTHPISL